MPVFAFEGLDGVGKTTQAEVVSKTAGGIVITQLNLGAHWKKERQAVNNGNDPDARFLYFLALNERQISAAHKAASIGITAVLESSVYRTVATHRVLGSGLAREYEIGSALQADSTIYLDLAETERQARLVKRDTALTFSSHWDVTLHERADELRETYEAFELPTLDASLPPSMLKFQVLEQLDL